MKVLLEQDFAGKHGEGGRSYPINSQAKYDFAFGDSHACLQCRPFFADGCNNQVFLVHSDHDITYIPIEEFIGMFPCFSNKERCDILLYDARKIVLSDMFCGQSAYALEHIREGERVIGKKTKVFNQIESTLDILYSVPAIADWIDARADKIGVFVCSALPVG